MLMLRMFCLILIFLFFSCESVQWNLGGDFSIKEHDLSVTRSLCYRSQGIGSNPICAYGSEGDYIWVMLCRRNDDSIYYYLVSRSLYANDPNQKESVGYWAFSERKALIEMLDSKNIKVNWKKQFSNPYSRH